MKFRTNFTVYIYKIPGISSETNSCILPKLLSGITPNMASAINLMIVCFLN